MAEMKKPQTDTSVMALMQQPSMIAQLRMALPRHVTPERLARIVMTNLRQTPELLKCTRESLLGAVMQAAQLGLEPGVLGQCYLVPYKGTATLIIGYRGMAQLAWRSALVSSISSRAVFEGDHFFFDYGADKLEHRPFGESDPDKLTHAYAVIHTTHGGRLWEVMTRTEIETIRERSAAGKRGPWVTDYTEMCKKTVLRRLFKIAPASAEMNRAMALEDAADVGESQGLEFDLPLGEYSVEAEVPSTPATAPDDTAALLQLDVTIGNRAEEFTEPKRARAAIQRALEAEFGPLRELKGARIVEATQAAAIVQVDVK